MLKTRASSLITFFFLVSSTLAAADELRIQAGGEAERLPSGTTWEGGAELLVAPLHPLQPRLAVDGLDVTLPGGGVLRITPLRAGSLARGEAPLLAREQAQPLVAILHDSWTGLEERFTLRGSSLKHDLVLHEASRSEARGEDFRASWLLEPPAGSSLALEARAGLVLRDSESRFLARFPLPTVGDAGAGHLDSGVARYELHRTALGLELDVLVPASWLDDPARVFPLLIDPTVELEPFDGTVTGFVTEVGLRSEDEIVAGSLDLIGFGSDVRGYAQFDTSAIPDDASITSVHLEAWLANHDNPPTAAEPTVLDIRPCPMPFDSPIDELHAAIGMVFDPDPYVNTAVFRTGAGFCAEAFEFHSYDLGPAAIADLEGLLSEDWFAVGLVADTSPNPSFQHVDVIGFTEDVAGIGCAELSVVGGRIALVVGFETDSVCVPRNHGYWHRYCLGQDAIDPGRRGHGNGPGPKKAHADLPPGLLAGADADMAAYGLGACQALDEGPFSDPLLAALRELSTLHLNMGAGFLKAGCPVELHPVDDSPDLTVADAVALMEALIMDGSDRALHDARWIGAHVANGEALVRGE